MIDVIFGYLDMSIYNHEPMDKILASWEKQKKDKHGKHFHEQRKHFSLFVLSVDGLLGKESLVLFANLSWLMAAKMDKTILYVRG